MKKQKDNVQVPQSGQIAVNTKEHSLLRHIKKEWRLYSLMIIPLLYYIIFHFLASKNALQTEDAFRLYISQGGFRKPGPFS